MDLDQDLEINLVPEEDVDQEEEKNKWLLNMVKILRFL
jgi:hypothetical protein